MKKTQFNFKLALLSAGLFASYGAAAHTCYIDLTAAGTTICGDAPFYNVYTTSKLADGSVQLNATPQPLPAGFTGNPVCLLGDIDPVSGIACTYTPSGGNQFEGKGWITGTTKTLGDSHALHGGNFFAFSLGKKSNVTISFQNDAAYNTANALGKLDAAFSVYDHLLPDDSHDDNVYDLLNETTANGFPMLSLADAAPTDPNQWKYVDVGGVAAFINPLYKAKTYTSLYPANNAYRDTLNYTQTGGLYTVDTPDPLFPSIIYLKGTPINPYVGQFNAKGNWSMANGDADPADPANVVTTNADKTRYLTSQVLQADGTYLPTVTWSELKFRQAVNANTGTKAGNAETVTLSLPAGDYTIAAGGANSLTDGAGYGGIIKVKIK